MRGFLAHKAAALGALIALAPQEGAAMSRKSLPPIDLSGLWRVEAVECAARAPQALVFEDGAFHAPNEDDQGALFDSGDYALIEPESAAPGLRMSASYDAILEFTLTRLDNGALRLEHPDCTLILTPDAK